MSKFASISLGNAPATRQLSALETLAAADNVGLVLDNNGELYVRFVVNQGRGTGGQVVPLAMMPEFIQAFREYSDPARLQTVAGAQDAVSVMRNTIALKDETVAPGQPILVSFRTNGDKGQKPATLRIEEIEPVCDALESYLPALEALADQYRAQQKKKV